MTCPGCGSTVQADFAFCPRCGGKLERAPIAATARRRRPPRATARRGTAGSAIAEEGDRRLVTVLFADLAGFTALAESLDPEEVRAFQTDLFRELSGAIERYDGFVEKFVGDAVMAVFGAPHAHEDDPERALHAALLMHERVAALSERWERRVGRPLALHVGVNTGPVVAGTIGSASGGAYAVTGDTVNTASRLQSAAAAAETFVSPSTHQLTEHAFRPGSGGRDRDEGEEPAARRLPARRGARDPALRRAVCRRWDSALPWWAGRRSSARWSPPSTRCSAVGRECVSLTGEAGVGKSRLLQEWLATLEAGGRLTSVSVRHAVCSSLGEQPYAVFAAFFREAYGVAPGDSLEVARQKLAAGLAALGGEGEETATIASLLGYVLGVEAADRFRHVEPEQLKRQIFLAMRRLIERRLQQGPLVLTVENLHWADAASVELLQVVLDRLADQPLMLVATCRPGAEAGPSPRPERSTRRSASRRCRRSRAKPCWRPTWASRPRACRRASASSSSIGPSGQPLYLEEILRGLIAAGVLVRGETGWTCTAGARGRRRAADHPRAPARAGSTVSRRRRGTLSRRRRSSARCSTRPSSARWRATPRPSETALEQLRDGDFLEDAAGPTDDAAASAPRDRRYRFTNALLQEVAYQSLLLRRRTELHARAGQALEGMVGGRPTRLEDIEALARHWGLGGDRRKAARYLVAAGDWARGLYANEDAIQHYERALATLAQCRGARGEVSTVARATRRHPRAPRPSRRGARTLRGGPRRRRGGGGPAEPGPARAQARDPLLGRGRPVGGRARLRAGLELMAGHPEHIELAHLYHEMGRQAFRSGDNEGAVAWAERALAQAERLARRRSAPTRPVAADRAAEVASAMAQAYNTLGVALARMGRLQDAVGHIERSVAVAEAHDLMQAACRGYTNLGVLYSTLDPKRAIDTCLRGLEMAKKIGDLGLQSRLNTNLAVAYCALTNRCEERGLSAAQTALDLDRQLGQLDHLAVPLIVLGQIQQCHGDPELARGYYQEALALVEPTGEPQFLFPCYDGLATLYLDRDDHDAGRGIHAEGAAGVRAGRTRSRILRCPSVPRIGRRT